MIQRFVLACVFLTIPAHVLAQPAGWKIDESGCASGGPTTYFFGEGTVVKEDCGDDCPVVTSGTWKKEGDELVVTWRQRFFGKGSVQSPGPTPARTMYEEYAGKFEALNERESVSWPDDEGCATASRHDKKDPDPRSFLKSAFVGRFGFTSEREVKSADIAGLSKADLEIMRNEVYARYGHTFKNAKLRKHFEAQPGYVARFTEVSAFLSPLERANVAFILEAEKKAK